ncbi:MAG: thioredoxin domain-containing protein [Pseudomonadota bacterium]
MTLTRRLLTAASLAAGLVLAACGGGGGAADSGRGAFEREDDVAKGSPDAPVTMVEYASVACGGCGVFHNTVMPSLQSYIDEGEVRYVFREMLTGQVQLAVAGFMLARCAEDDEGYLEIVEVLFQQQRALFVAMQAGNANDQLQAIARSAGFTDERYRTCLTDETLLEQVRQANDQAVADGIGSTPTFIFNGELLETARGPDGGGLVYAVGGEPLVDEQGSIPAEFTADSFERIILHYKARAESGGENVDDSDA